MWYSPDGDRTLEGAEANFFRFGLAALVRRLPAYPGPGYFSRLTTGEKLVALAAAGQALLDPTEPSPEHTAWIEAAIYAVYRHLEVRVGRSGRTRRLTAAAFRQADPDAPALTSGIEFSLALEELADRILWNRDWELEDEMGQADACYFAPPPAATPERVQAALDYLHALAAT
jgi:hypothetical protein